MYPIGCSGGYAIPCRGGKRRIVAIALTPKTLGTDTRLTLIDDYSEKNKKWGSTAATQVKDDNSIIDLKIDAGTVDGSIFIAFPEPITVRNAISIVNANNTQPGYLCVYEQ